MKKIIIVLALVLTSGIMTSCSEEDVTPMSINSEGSSDEPEY